MNNLPLFVLDWIILLPITIIRLILIYLYGSRYGIPGAQFLDIMMHAKNPNFNIKKKTMDVETRSIKENIDKLIS